MDPGPVDDRVLTLQANHRSQAIWEGADVKPLILRSHMQCKDLFTVSPTVANYISGTQFHGVHKLSYVACNPDLITALVERWRQETHTFHLSVGEVGITLQDVNVLLGLRVGGLPITGTAKQDWIELITEHLGEAPPPNVIKGNTLKLNWLKDTFEVLPPNHTQEQLERYVRAYLLYLLGTILFPDKSGNRVHLIYFPLLIDLHRLHDYSWGSGVLAYLYRNLCVASRKNAKEIGGCLILMQLWCWERISIGRPRILRSRLEYQAGMEYYIGSQIMPNVDPLGCKWLNIDRKYTDHLEGLITYRQAFDFMTDGMFTWEPYTLAIVNTLPPICHEDEEEWIVLAPLICFEIVEWHLPNRVVRQFGWHPEVPPLCNTSVELHESNRRGTSTDYADKFAGDIDRWMARKANLVPQGAPYDGFIHYNDPYLDWYRDITRRIISPHSVNVQPSYVNNHYNIPTPADYGFMAQGHVRNYQLATQFMQDVPEDLPLAKYQLVQQMQMMSLKCLQRTGQGHLIDEPQSDEEEPNNNEEDQEQEEEPQSEAEEDMPESSSAPARNKKKRRWFGRF